MSLRGPYHMLSRGCLMSLRVYATEKIFCKMMGEIYQCASMAHLGKKKSKYNPFNKGKKIPAKWVYSLIPYLQIRVWKVQVDP